MSWPDAFRFSLSVLASVGGGGVLVFALSSWLGKVWATRILEKERAAYANELEGRRAELSRLVAESQIRYSHLHDRRVTVISGIYARLEDLHAAVRAQATLNPTTNTPELDAARQRTAEAFQKLASYFYRRGIWLDPETCDAIHAIMELIDKTTRGLQYHLYGWELPKEKLRDLNDRLEVEIPAARGLLDERFRNILSTGEAQSV